jgi:hypothetical protein
MRRDQPRAVAAPAAIAQPGPVEVSQPRKKLDGLTTSPTSLRKRVFNEDSVDERESAHRDLRCRIDAIRPAQLRLDSLTRA